MNYRKMAKLAMSHGRYATSQSYAETALGRLGHPMPQTLLSLIAATMWQIIRQLSHRVGFGLVLGMTYDDWPIAVYSLRYRPMQGMPRG